MPPCTAGTAEQHQVAGAGGITAATHHKGAAECLDHGPHKGVLPQHLRTHLVRQPVKAAGGGGGGVHRLGRGAAQQAVLPQRPGEVAAHFAHVLGGGSPGPLHRVQCIGGVFLPFLGRGHGVQLGLHLAHRIAGGGRLLRRGGVFAAAHQAFDPVVVVLFKAHVASPLF